MRYFWCFFCGSLCLLLLNGCRRNELPRLIIHGTVTCGGEKVAFGEVRFVPIEGTAGPATVARIIDGQYRVENRGGVPLGKHRVEIFAQRPTGRKFSTPEEKTVEEAVEIGNPAYAGSKSPLTVTITADGDGRFDFDIPKK